MAGFVDTTVKEIEARLAELGEEVKRLEAARAALIGSGRPSGQPRGSRGARAPRGAVSTPKRSGRRPGRPRGSRGGNTRAKEALALVRTRPGITIPEIAEELKILPNYLYRVMPKLVADGSIRRDGQGWFPLG
jgi:hypothetical protein